MEQIRKKRRYRKGCRYVRKYPKKGQKRIASYGRTRWKYTYKKIPKHLHKKVGVKPTDVYDYLWNPKKNKIIETINELYEYTGPNVGEWSDWVGRNIELQQLNY